MPQKNLPAYIASLNERNLKNIFGKKTYDRGLAYYDDGHVLHTVYKNKNTELYAEVQGNRKYKVSIELDGDELVMDCSCPVGLHCKHAAAVLLSAIRETPENNDAVLQNQQMQVRRILEKLSKEEIITLFIEKMPGQVMQGLGNTVADKTTAANLLKKAYTRTEDLFENDDLLYNVEAFAGRLETILQSLAGLEKIIPQELADFLLDIIQHTHNAIEEGFLYDDYNDAMPEIPELFFQLAGNAVRALPAARQADAIENFTINLSEADYNTFDSLNDVLRHIHQADEQSDPKTRLLNRLAILPDNFIRNEYRVLEKDLNDAEKEQVLLRLRGYTDMLMKLSELYCGTGRDKQALQLLRDPVNDKQMPYLPENILMQYMHLEKAAGSNMETIGTAMLKRMPTVNMIAAIIKITGLNLPAWEKYLETHQPFHMLAWLEKNNRIAEAMQLVNKTKNPPLDKRAFLLRHKKQFREEAETLLCKLIDDNLQYTGDRAYNEIVRCISHIREINPEMADGIVTDIRTRFAKRRKLLELLAGR